MGFVCGIFHRDGAPCEQTSLAKMIDAGKVRGPDAQGHIVVGSLGLGHGALWTCPEEVGSSQPLADDDGTVLVFDGRLDNRDELIELVGRPAAGISDARLVLDGYRRLGRGVLPRLIGPFALALWDPHERGLLC